jgi:Tfp pilus assembly protein PilZ
MFDGQDGAIFLNSDPRIALARYALSGDRFLDLQLAEESLRPVPTEITLFPLPIDREETIRGVTITFADDRAGKRVAEWHLQGLRYVVHVPEEDGIDNTLLRFASEVINRVRETGEP